MIVGGWGDVPDRIGEVARREARTPADHSRSTAKEYMVGSGPRNIQLFATHTKRIFFSQNPLYFIFISICHPVSLQLARVIIFPFITGVDFQFHPVQCEG